MKLLNQSIRALVQNVAEYFADLKAERLRTHLDWSRHEADGKIRRVRGS